MTETFFVKIFDYFFDNTKKITAKLFVIFLIVSTLWVIDNVFYFSKNGHYSYKLKQVKEINEILKDSLLFSNSEREELIQIRKHILKEKYIFDLEDYYKKIETKIISNEVTTGQTKEIIIKRNDFKELKQSFWYILFSVFFPAALLLIFIGNAFETITDKEKRKELDFKYYLLTIPAIFLFLFLTYLFYYSGQVTPIFFENHLWVNYVYNLYAPILMIIIIAIISTLVENVINDVKNSKESNRSDIH